MLSPILGVAGHSKTRPYTLILGHLESQVSLGQHPELIRAILVYTIVSVLSVRLHRSGILPGNILIGYGA